MNLLVVEDNPGVRKFLVSGLQAEGYTVTSVESGEEALKLIKNTLISCCSI